jgi:fluoride ion exporter CrcB/FEX
MSDHTSLAPRQLIAASATVLIGGAIGTLARYGVLKAVTLTPAHWCAYHCASQWAHTVPWTLLGINVLGVYVATWLLSGPLQHQGSTNRSRLFFITGIFGGFTSYSSLYVALGLMWAVNPLAAVLTGLAALLSGVLAGWLGLRTHR